MRKGPYPPELRQRVLRQLAAGERVADIARDQGISYQTVYNWRRQDLVDRGIEPGLSSPERHQLRAARRRIRVLEAELARDPRRAEQPREATGAMERRRSDRLE